jgi:hypothetical protein
MTGLACVSVDSGNMKLDSLAADHWIFCAIDGFVYLIIFLILAAVLRLSLKVLAKHEADDGYGKACVTTALILTTIAVVSTISWVDRFGYLMIIPYYLVAALISMWLCWISFQKGLLVALIFLTSVFIVGKGAWTLMDKSLPPGRITLVKKTKISMGILSEVTNQTGPPINTGELLQRAKSGLKLQAESVVLAVALLKDPDSLRKITAQHIEDLAVLDLLADGGMLTSEQLEELGIVHEDARQGARVLKYISATNEVSEQDVMDVVEFLKSVRKDGSEVTAEDAVIVLREAMNRAGRMSTNGLNVTNVAAMCGISTSALVRVDGASTGDTTSVGQPSAIVELTNSNLVNAKSIPVNQVKDPFHGISPEVRKAWYRAQTGLVVTGVMAPLRGRAYVVVNGGIVSTGDVVAVNSAGRVFSWRLKGVEGTEAVWEPSIGREFRG